MALTFRKFSANARLSEETTAYATDVLWKGKLLGHCRNDGRGGMGIFHRAEGVKPGAMEEALEWVKTQHYEEPDGSPSTHNGKILGFDHIEDYCDYLAGRQMAEKQLRQQAQRALKRHIVFEDPAAGPGLFQVNQVFHPAVVPALLKRHPQAVILNTLPMEEAIEKFRAEAIRADKEAQRAWAAKKGGPSP